MPFFYERSLPIQKLFLPLYQQKKTTMEKEIIEAIKIGDTIRSYDFGKDHPDCYIEGTVEEIGRLLDWQGCDVYKVKCTKKVFSGKVIVEHEEYYFPPVNGTPMMGSGVCDFVSKIEKN